MRCRILHPVMCVLVAFVLPVNTLLAGGPVNAKKAAKAAAFAEEVNNLYAQIDLQEVGLTKKAFE